MELTRITKERTVKEAGLEGGLWLLTGRGSPLLGGGGGGVQQEAAAPQTGESTAAQGASRVLWSKPVSRIP